MARSAVRKFGSGPSIPKIRASIATLPVKLALATAAASAPALTTMTQASFAAGQTVYGELRPVGKYGPVGLVKSGQMRRHLRFSSAGRLVRIVLGLPYVKYMIGRFVVLPIGNAAIPAAWKRAIDTIAKREAMRFLPGAAERRAA